MICLVVIDFIPYNSTVLELLNMSLETCRYYSKSVPQGDLNTIVDMNGIGVTKVELPSERYCLIWACP